MDSDRKFPCKQAKLTAEARLDRTQEAAGSSPASSTAEVPALASRDSCFHACCLDGGGDVRPRGEAPTGGELTRFHAVGRVA
jgi:hypothetical protein